jgi:DNA-binding protein HU-beta
VQPHVQEEIVNKAELIEALSARLGDRRAATSALDAVLSEIQNAVTKGDKVAITGFGVFEKKVRAARTARNPRTGEAVKVKKTSVPAFRPGAGFRELVASGKVPKVAKAAAAKGATKAATKSTATKTATRSAAAKATATKSTAKATKAAPAKKTTAKATKAAAAPAARKTTTAKATTAKATTAKATTAKATTVKATTAKTVPGAKKAPAKKR